MEIQEKCYLCFCEHTECNSLLQEGEELANIIDKIFRFPIIRIQDSTPLVCESCIANVQGFFEYSEQVERNQDLIKYTLPSTSPRLVQLKVETTDSVSEYDYETYEVITNDDTHFEEVFLEENKVNTEESKGDVNLTYSDKVSTAGSESEENEEENVEQTEQKPKTPKRLSNRKDIEKQVLQDFTLTCDICEQTLVDFADLLKHFKHTHKTKGYLKCCDRKIFIKWAMIEHLQLHLFPDAFHCDLCNKSYSSSRVLREHTKERHAPNETRRFKCKTCLKLFVSKRHLNAHMTVAHGAILCPHCPRLLASKGSLKYHLWSAHGEGEGKEHICDICAQVFRSKSCLETHVQRHQGTRNDNKMQCNVCMAWFTDKNCLTKHVLRMHIHSDMEWKCEICFKLLPNRDALNSHLNRTHREGRFKCEICAKVFKRVHHMKEHVAIHHTGEDIYGCKYCQERFKTRNKQLAHRKTVHPIEWEQEMRKRALKTS